MNKTRCSWSLAHDELYQKYHDEEWGSVVHEDRYLFEMLCLESMQAGLSWRTILNKRENYIKAFNNFDFNKIALYDQMKFNELMENSGIIRNRSKIRAIINNAQAFITIRKEFKTFDEYLWRFVQYQPIHNKWSCDEEIPAKSPLSELISGDLKKRGMQFVGPVTTYSFLQAVGVINDHITSCYRYTEIIQD